MIAGILSSMLPLAGAVANTAIGAAFARMTEIGVERMLNKQQHPEKKIDGPGM